MGKSHKSSNSCAAGDILCPCWVADPTQIVPGRQIDSIIQRDFARAWFAKNKQNNRVYKSANLIPQVLLLRFLLRKNGLYNGCECVYCALNARFGGPHLPKLSKTERRQQARKYPYIRGRPSAGAVRRVYSRNIPFCGTFGTTIFLLLGQLHFTSTKNLGIFHINSIEMTRSRFRQQCFAMRLRRDSLTTLHNCFTTMKVGD